MKSTVKVARNEDELHAIARELVPHLEPGRSVLLWGPLGAGKTTFVRALAREFGIKDDVSSPTFVFWHRYNGSVPIVHVDLYRIKELRELSELGLEEAFDPAAITIIEWPAFLVGMLPEGSVCAEVEIEGAGSEPRTVTITVPGLPTEPDAAS